MIEITSEMVAKWKETVDEPPPGYWVPTSEVVRAAREMLPAVTNLLAEVERLRAERQKVADTLWSAAAFVRSWQLCELRHMSDAPSARAACALEQAFRLLSVQTEPPEHKS